MAAKQLGDFTRFRELAKTRAYNKEKEQRWHSRKGTLLLGAAASKNGCEVTVPIRPLDLLNDVAEKPWPVRVAFFRGPDGELIELLEDKTGYT